MRSMCSAWYKPAARLVVPGVAGSRQTPDANPPDRNDLSPKSEFRDRVSPPQSALPRSFACQKRVGSC